MPARVLKARDFVHLCEELALRDLPVELRPPERRASWAMLQWHYGDPNVHFELNPSPGRHQLELGLHLEGEAGANDVWAARLAELADELMPALGDGWELEEWTASWRRLHRVFVYHQLTPELAEEVATELQRAIRVLGPVVAAPDGFAALRAR